MRDLLCIKLEAIITGAIMTRLSFTGLELLQGSSMLLTKLEDTFLLYRKKPTLLFSYITYKFN